MSGQVRKRAGAGSAARKILGLILAMSLAACVNRGGPIPYDPANFGPPDRAAPENSAYDLPLGPLDLVKITVFRVPELSGEYQVDAKGMLDMPLIGLTNVRDQTPQQLAELLEQRYSNRYLNAPEITVRVMSSLNNTVTVEGGVNAPGIYALSNKITLIGAIAMARGIAAQDANPRRIAVFRKVDGKTMAAAFDLIAIRRGEMADPVIFPGDVIVIDSSQVRPLFRDILQSLPILSLFLQI